jgi:hypothetical protein
MDIFGALRSKYRAGADKAAFEMNMCFQKQMDEKSLDNMDRAIRAYALSMNCLGVLEQLEKSYNNSQLKETEDEN